MEILFTFDGTNDAIRAESVLLEGGVAVKVMNLPSSIKAGCGISLRVPPAEAETAARLLAGEGVTPSGRWRREMQNGASHYTPIKENENE